MKNRRKKGAEKYKRKIEKFKNIKTSGVCLCSSAPLRHPGRLPLVELLDLLPCSKPDACRGDPGPWAVLWCGRVVWVTALPRRRRAPGAGRGAPTAQGARPPRAPPCAALPAHGAAPEARGRGSGLNGLVLGCCQQPAGGGARPSGLPGLPRLNSPGSWDGPASPRGSRRAQHTPACLQAGAHPGTQGRCLSFARLPGTPSRPRQVGGA